MMKTSDLVDGQDYAVTSRAAKNTIPFCNRATLLGHAMTYAEARQAALDDPDWRPHRYDPQGNKSRKVWANLQYVETGRVDTLSHAKIFNTWEEYERLRAEDTKTREREKERAATKREAEIRLKEEYDVFFESIEGLQKKPTIRIEHGGVVIRFGFGPEGSEQFLKWLKENRE